MLKHTSNKSSSSMKDPFYFCVIFQATADHQKHDKEAIHWEMGIGRILQMYFKFLCLKVAAGCINNNMVKLWIYFMHSHIYRNVYFIINHFPLQLSDRVFYFSLPFAAAAFYIKHARNEGSLLDKHTALHI